MKKTTLTVIEVSQENATDIYPIYHEGFDKERAISDALEDMQRFLITPRAHVPNPSDAKKGVNAYIGSIDAFEIEPDADEDDIAEELGCLYIEKVKADGKTFAITNETLDSGWASISFSSDEISAYAKSKEDEDEYGDTTIYWSDIEEYLIEKNK